jgi:hypothetical protein
VTAHLQQQVPDGLDDQSFPLDKRHSDPHEHVSRHLDEDDAGPGDVGPKGGEEDGLGITVAMILIQDLQGDLDAGRVAAVFDGRVLFIRDRLDERADLGRSRALTR